jgi:hypothetical protein
VLFCFFPGVDEFSAVVLFVTVVHMLLEFWFFVKLFTALFTGMRRLSPPSSVAKSVSQRDVFEIIAGSYFGCHFSNRICCGERFFSQFFSCLHCRFGRFLGQFFSSLKRICSILIKIKFQNFEYYHIQPTGSFDNFIKNWNGIEFRFRCVTCH